jgi:hypothetical protein
LADAIASKLRTGRAPKVLRAITFEPDGVQDDLKPVNEISIAHRIGDNLESELCAIKGRLLMGRNLTADRRSMTRQ